MTSNRPYLVRALYDWILDNGMTPYVLVDATRSRTVVPAQFVQDGKIVLNISPTAVRALALGNERIEFDARFGGVSMNVQVPVTSVLGIYARENGRGMLFPDEGLQTADTQGTEEKTGSTKPPRERPTLKVVK
jgi:stringent starvation protein B